MKYLDQAGLSHFWAKIKMLLANKSDNGHMHDDRYYTESEIDSKLASKADANHSHSAYAPSSHAHDDRYYTESEVDSKLASKADVNHSHSGYAPSSHVHDGRYIRYIGTKSPSTILDEIDDDGDHWWNVTVPALSVGELAGLTIGFDGSSYSNLIRSFKILGGGSYLINFTKTVSGNVNVAPQVGANGNVTNITLNYYRIS